MINHAYPQTLLNFPNRQNYSSHKPIKSQALKKKHAKLALIELNQHECTFYIIGDMISRI